MKTSTSRTDIYDPPFMKPASTALVAEARKRIKGMDRVDGGMSAYTLDEHLRTALTALQTAIDMTDWSIAADAYVMLQEAEQRVRQGK